MILSKAEITSGGTKLSSLSNMLDSNIFTYGYYTFSEDELYYKWLRITVHLEKESLISRVIVQIHDLRDTFDLLDDAQVKVVDQKKEDEGKEDGGLCPPADIWASNFKIIFNCTRPMIGDTVVIEKYVRYAPYGIRVKINEIEVYGTDKPKKKLTKKKLTKRDLTEKNLTNLKISFIVIGAVLGVLVLYFVINECKKSIERSDIDQEPRDHISSVQRNSVALEPTRQERTITEVIPTAPHLSHLSPPSYTESISVHGEDDVPSYEDVIANSDSFAIVNKICYDKS